MCGICGFITTEPSYAEKEPVLNKMCGVLEHRGPDDEGTYMDAHAALGIRRLSIIDLVTGSQPISNEDATVWVVLNGEIYNYREIRNTLQRNGHIFHTQSDTEVLVHAYEEYGDDCVTHFNGMFAFALWDIRRQRLLLARDHLGIKPLYYWQTSEGIVFGSELKALLCHPGVPTDIYPLALDQFLILEYIPAPNSIFRHVHKLPAGHILAFERGEVAIRRYWDVRQFDIVGDEQACVEQMRQLIQDAVRQQLVSDVPVGAFLSGGIDSSTVVACMQEAVEGPVETFSIGFDDQTYNELAYAREVARLFQCNHHEEIIQPDIATLAECLVGQLDEPFGDFSIFPTYLVSQLASKHVKVILSGDGGDEVFAGYDTYVAQEMDSVYQLLPAVVRAKILPAIMNMVSPRPEKKGLINKAKRFVEGGALDPGYQHTRWMMFLNQDHCTRLYQTDVAETLRFDNAMGFLLNHFEEAQRFDSLGRRQYVDIKSYLVDNILVKVDRMTMAASIEARVPLLDYRIVEFALNLSSSMKLKGGQTKRILRAAMQTSLPKSVLTRPKEGFSIPLRHWLRGPLKPMMTDLLTPTMVKRRGYFNANTISQWVCEHLEARADHSHRLWGLMLFELWCQQVLDIRLPAAAISTVQSHG